MSKNKNRPDQDGHHRKAYERNRKKILATQDICAICGKPVDKSLKFPHPMSATCDHIIPIVRGGHPSDLDNLQLAHLICNMNKKDNINYNPSVNTDTDTPQLSEGVKKKDGGVGGYRVLTTNRNLPKLRDWENYRK